MISIDEPTESVSIPTIDSIPVIENLCSEYAPAQEFEYGEWWYAYEDELFLRHMPEYCDEPVSEISLSVTGLGGGDLPSWL